MKHDQKKVLVTAIGSFASDAVIRGLKNEGYKVAGCDIYPREWVAQALDVAHFYQAPPASDRKAYGDFIARICEEERISYVVPLTDVEVDALDCCRASLEGAGTVLCVSGHETLSICRDKYRLFKFLRERGLGPSIPSKLLSETVPEEIIYPAVVKPRRGRSSQGLHRAENIRQMRYLLNAVLEPREAGEYIVQPRLEGSVVTVDLVRDPVTRRTVCLPRRELLRTLNGAGTSVCAFRSGALEQRCREIADALEIRGCVNFEWIESILPDKSASWSFLECNPRFSGGVAFSCEAGYDMVGNHMRCFEGREIQPDCMTKTCYIARKYGEYVTGPV